VIKGLITVRVDRDVCQDHGQCVFAAPQVFELDEEGKLVVLQEEVDESLRDVVEEAADVCPVQAITIEG
jgi:ferredoxin